MTLLILAVFILYTLGVIGIGLYAVNVSFKMGYAAARGTLKTEMEEELHTAQSGNLSQFMSAIRRRMTWRGGQKPTTNTSRQSNEE